jgi:hypothetical protein
MEIARMQQAERMQQQQIAARQQSQMYGAATDQQQMLLQNRMAQQMAAQNAAQQMAKQQAEFGFRKDLYGTQNQFEQQQQVAAHKQAVQNSMLNANAELHQLVGGIDESQLTSLGQPIYREVRNKMTQFQAAIDAGDRTPEDLYVGVREILGKASALKMPGMVSPPMTAEEEIAKSTIEGKDGRIYSRDPKTNMLVKTDEYATVNGVPVGKTTVDQQSGNIGFYKKDGTFVPTFNKGKELREIEKEEAKAYDDRAKAIIAAEADPEKMQGLIDKWYNPTKRKEEIAAGVQRRWSTLEQSIYRDFQSSGVAQQMPGQAPLGPPVPGVPQPQPGAMPTGEPVPQPQTTVTPAQPSGVPPAPPTSQPTAPGQLLPADLSQTPQVAWPDPNDPKNILVPDMQTRTWVQEKDPVKIKEYNMDRYEGQLRYLMRGKRSYGELSPSEKALMRQLIDARNAVKQW